MRQNRQSFSHTGGPHAVSPAPRRKHCFQYEIVELCEQFSNSIMNCNLTHVVLLEIELRLAVVLHMQGTNSIRSKNVLNFRIEIHQDVDSFPLSYKVRTEYCELCDRRTKKMNSSIVGIVSRIFRRQIGVHCFFFFFTQFLSALCRRHHINAASVFIDKKKKTAT